MLAEPKGRCAGRRRSAGALAALSLALIILGGGVFLPNPTTATPWTGGEPTPTNVVLFLHNSSNGTTVGAVRYLNILSTVSDSQTPWNGTGARAEGAHYDSVAFVVAPQLAGPLTINGTVGANIYMNESGSAPTGGSVTLTVYSVSVSGTLTLLGTGPGNPATPLGPGGSSPKLIALTGPALDRTVAAGDSVEVNVTINGNTAESYGIWWGFVEGTTYASTVTVPVSTYLTVPEVSVRDSNGSVTTDLTPTTGNATVSVTAGVSDPLGAYDFETLPVEFSVVDRASTTVVFGPVAMTPVPDLAAPGAPNGSYELAFNYSGLATGQYNFTVTAIDNTNENLGSQSTLPAYYGREAIGVAIVTVGLPPVPIRVAVVDDHGRALPGATVLVRSTGALVAQNSTNASGIAGFDLSNSTAFAFSVRWQGVSVGSVVAAVTGAGQILTLHAAVGYPVFHIQTSSQAPLAFALVSIVHPNGTVLPLLVANSTGELALSQVPWGNYSVTVIYDDAVVVSARAVSVTGDGPVVVVTDTVFTLAVSTTGSDGSSLPAVFVQVINASSGATVASGVTDGSGALQFLVPAGNYRVVGSWSSTYALTNLAQTEQVNVSVTGPGSIARLSFSKAYPAFTSTNEFFLLVGYGVLATLVVLLGFLLLRRRRAAAGPRASSPAPPHPPPGGGERSEMPASPPAER